MRYLIGIDMGTTNVKALLFDEQGNTAGEARCPSPITLLPDGGGVFDPEELWRLCCRLLTELLDANPMPEIARDRKDGSAVESAEQQNKRERTWDLNEGYTAEKTEQEKSAKFLCSEARFVERRFPNHPRCAEQADL